MLSPVLACRLSGEKSQLDPIGEESESRSRIWLKSSPALESLCMNFRFHVASFAGVAIGAVFDLDLVGLVPRTRRLNGVGALSEYNQSRPVH